MACARAQVKLYSKHTGQTDEVVAAAKERDTFMTPQQAADFGLVDAVVAEREGPAPPMSEHK